MAVQDDQETFDAMDVMRPTVNAWPKGKWAPLAFALAVVACLFGFWAVLFPGALKDARHKFHGGFREGSSTISEDCRKNIPFRTHFVDLNGLFARITGRRICNKRHLLNNGMLGMIRDRSDAYVPRCIDGVSTLRDAAEGMSAKFIYVQFPGKPDMEGRLVPFGMRHNLTELAAKIMVGLRARGVDTLDLGPKYSLTPELVERYFFRTDHHWKFETAFAVADDVARRICAIAGVACPEGAAWPLDGSNWERHVMRDCFLGSAGKRTGRFFGGLDDIVYLLPCFRCKCKNVLFDAAGCSSTVKGDFGINIDDSVVCAAQDVYEFDGYRLYKGVGGIHPCVIQRRRDAPIRLRVAVLGDSFSRPFASFLSTVFSDVLSADPRYPCGGVMPLKRVLDFRPDVVALCLSPNILSGRPPKGGRMVFFEYPLAQ